MGKIRLKTWEGVQATTIEVTTSFADVADEKQFFVNQADNQNESDPSTEKTIPARCMGIGSKQGTILTED